jgi:hypothetical protein
MYTPTPILCRPFHQVEPMKCIEEASCHFPAHELMRFSESPYVLRSARRIRGLFPDARHDCILEEGQVEPLLLVRKPGDVYEWVAH